MRRCRSFKEIREEDMSDASGDELDVENFISAPNSPREKEFLHNPKFFGRMSEFKRAQRLRDN
jgi:hypothetical protein